MTTAYTSLLGLALPVTGELSGTWGDVVNNSITGLLDTAVAGTTTLSTDADVTLSTTTGAANQARQAIILWTASGTVTRTITAPAQSKIYTIINRSSTQSIKIVGVGPTTGVTVKSGATVTVAWNGLDFVEISVSTLYPTVTISGNMDNGTTDNSLNNAPTVKSAVTTLASVYLSNPSTEAASFTLTDLVGYRAEQGTFGASSTVTNQYGFYANSDLTGATNNYGLYSGIAATAAVTISSVNGTGSTVTVDTSTSHGLDTGDKVIIAGVSNTTMTAGSYNGGPYTITKVDADTFTYSSTATSSAAVTSGGSVVKANNWNIYAGGTGNNWFGGPIINSVSSVLPALRITQTGTGDALLVEDSTNPDSTPFVIDASGQVVRGYTAPVATVSYTAAAATPSIQNHGASVSGSSYGAFAWVANTVGPNFNFSKSRSATIGTPSIVSSGDLMGALTFAGDDGAGFILGASITSLVDGTPGTNDMPGRLVFSTTADGASTPTERMRIDNAGAVGIGTTSLTARRLVVGGSLTGATSAYGSLVSPTVQPDVTANVFISASQGATAANGGTPYTIGNIVVYQASQGTFNADSTVTNQYGFNVPSTLTGATNNYAFRGALASATGRYNLYMDGTANNYLAGALGIGSATLTQFGLRMSKSITGAVASYGIYSDSAVQSDVTSAAAMYASNSNTQATAFTLGNLRHYQAVQGTFGAGSTVTNQSGFLVDSTLTGATNNYGFHGNLAAATGVWNLFMAGTADNYLAGKTGIGTTPATGQILRVGGSLTGATTARQIASAATVASDVTARADTFISLPATAASAFTLGILSHYHAAQGTIGSTSAVTTQYGFEVDNSLTGATNNYGFYGNIASGTGRYNFYAAGTADNYFAGNVGIGTSSPATRLNVSYDVAGNTPYLDAGTTVLISNVNATGSAGIKLKSGATAYPSYITYDVNSGSSGALVFYDRGASTERMRIDSSGNVGIGTAGGTYGLALNRSSNNGSTIQINNSTLNASFLLQVDTAGTAYVQQQYAGALAFATSNSEKMRIDSSGNVGIGQTSQVWDEKLGVRLATSGSGTVGLGVYSASTTYASSMIRVQAETGGSGWKMYEGRASGGSQLFWVDGSGGAYFAGNVGIGTSSPTGYGNVNLNLNSSGDTMIHLTNTTSGTASSDGFDILLTGLNAQLINREAGYVSVFTSATERMRIDSSGNMQMQAGAVMPYAPTPASISTTATLTNANIQAQIINTTGTSYTVTMPLGTTLESLASWVTTNVAYDFFVINTASGTITMAVNTGVTSLGGLTIATGVSAHFRIRRTTANTFVLYRLV